MNFYMFSSTTMDSCSMAKPLREEARKTWLCTGCGFPKPDTKHLDATLQDRNPDNTPLNFISGCGLGIAKKKFLFSFGEEVVRQHLYLGSVYGPKANLLEDWITFVGRERIIVRGSKSAGVRSCTECGRNAYFATGQLYLYPMPRAGVQIFDAGSGALVVTEELAGRINLKDWRKLDCTKLHVVDVPNDGFVDLRGPYKS